MTDSRRVLGVDPGLTATGFGVVDGDGSAASAVAMGVIRTRPRDTRPERLWQIAKAIGELADAHRPDEIAVEQQYVAQNVRSAMAIGEARAAVLVAAAMREIPVHEYAPASIKEAVTGYGGATKEQVQEMVMVHLALTEEPSPLDVSDALAIALTRLAEVRLEDAVAAAGGGGAAGRR